MAKPTQSNTSAAFTRSSCNSNAMHRDDGSRIPSMANSWVLLHGGALGDLVLTVQLALRVLLLRYERPLGSPGWCEARPLHLPIGPRGDGGEGVGAVPLHIVSRVALGDLSACRPPIVWQSSEGRGLHWLFAENNGAPPPQLIEIVRGQRLLSALGGPETGVHQRILTLEPAELYSFEPRRKTVSPRHITAQWQTQLEAQGLLFPKCIRRRPAQRCVGVPGALRERGRRLVQVAGGDDGYVIIHPGSGGRAKCWPLARFVDVGRRLRDAGLSVCFVVGPVELENWPQSTWSALLDAFVLLSSPSPDDLVALLAEARAFVGNDSGPSHLAALLGTPTVVVFGPTAADVWQPLGARVVTFQGNPGRWPENWGVESTHVVSAALDSMS